jgi:hypothetical protein
MADVRLALVLLAACANADAESQAGAVTSPANMKPPAGWSAQPSIVAAAKAALGKTTVDGLEAFGEPAMGCYSVWMSLRSTGGAKDVGEQVLRGLDKVTIKDLVKPTADDGILSLTFEKSPYRGRMRARISKGSIKALACWWSQREPVACEQACTAVLGGLP